MKAIDTNILSRYFLQDNPAQYDKVRKLFQKTKLKNSQLFVSVLVVLEIIWVLESVYETPRQVIIDALLKAMALDFLRYEYALVLEQVLIFAKDNTFDLSDLMIGAIAQVNDCDTTLTFDRKASKSSYFELLTD